MLKLPKIINRTLSIRLSLMVVCEIALLLLASLVVMFHFSSQALRQEAMFNAEQTLEGTVQHIDNILLSMEQSAGNVYWDLIGHLDEPERMYTYSRELVKCNPYIVGCAIVFKPYYYKDRELFMAYVHRKGNSVMTDEDSELITSETFSSKPYTEQVWYTEPMKTGHTYWTDPLKNENTEDEALTTFCLPIYDKGECVGVLAVDLSIGLLSQIVLDVKPSPHGYSVLLGRNGSFIVHPDPEKLSHETVFTQTERGADPSVREAAEAMVAGETGSKSFRMNNSEWYVFYKPFLRTEVPGRSMENLKWSVGVIYPEDDIFGSYNRLPYYVLGIAFFGLLIFFFLCRWVTHRRLQPLLLLSDSAKRIAAGHYDEKVPDTNRGDEVGLLQDHFRRMQQSLEAHVTELKHLTDTLQERGKVLRDAYNRAQEANRMKTSFLHHMTNQMIAPSAAIKESVAHLCDNYHDVSLQEANHEVEVIQQQSKAIIDLVNTLIHTAESENRKEADDE